MEPFKRNGFSVHKTSARKNALLMMVNILVFVEMYMNKLLWLWS